MEDARAKFLQDYPIKLKTFLEHYKIGNYVIYVKDAGEIRSNFYDEKRVILIADVTEKGVFLRAQSSLSEYENAIAYVASVKGDVKNPLYKEDIKYITAKGKVTYFGNASAFEQASISLYERNEIKFDDVILKFIEAHCAEHQTRVNPIFNRHIVEAYGIDPEATAKDATKFKRGEKFIDPSMFEKPDAKLHDKAFDEEMVCYTSDLQDYGFKTGAFINPLQLQIEETLENGDVWKVIRRAESPYRISAFLNFPVINKKFGTNFTNESGFYGVPNASETAVQTIARVIGEAHPEYYKIKAWLNKDIYERNQNIGVDCEFNSLSRELVSFQSYSAQLGVGHIYFYMGAYPELPDFVDMLAHIYRPERMDFVAHFNHAEMSHFYKLEWGLGTLFNIGNHKNHSRRPFLNMDNSIVTPRYEKILVHNDLKECGKKFTKTNSRELYISFRDTYLIFNKEKLEKVGETIGIKKLDTNGNIERMNEYLMEEPLEYCKYAIKDAIICAVAIADHDHRIHAGDLVKTKKSATPETIPSISTLAGVYIQQKLDEIGEERFGIREFSRYHQGYVKLSQQELWKAGPRAFRGWKLLTSLEKEGEAYFGGRNECYTHGKVSDGTTDFDVKNAYPTAMMALYTPDYRNPLFLTDIKLEDIPDIAVGSVEVAFKFKDNVMYPNFPIKRNNSLLFVRQSVGYDESKGQTQFEKVQLMDFLYALRNDLLEGYELKSLTYFPPIRDEDGKPLNILGEIVSELVSLRYKATEPILKKYFKLLVNAAYGKLTQGINEMRKFNAFDFIYQDGLTDSERARKSRSKTPKSAIFNPAVAAAITAFVRIIVTETMEKLHRRGKEILSVTTDGFVVRGFSPDLNDKYLDDCGGTYCKYAREARAKSLYFEASSENSLWEIKHKTLPGEDYYSIAVRHYFAHAVNEDPEVAEKYQIAKGGIQTPRGVSIKEASEFLIDKYINCDEEINQSSLTSLQKTLEKGKTFTSNVRLQIKSWDYDLKRKPASPSKTTVSLGNEEAEKVYFRSVPFKDVEEYLSFKKKVTKADKERANRLQTFDEVMLFMKNKLNSDFVFRTRDTTSIVDIEELILTKIRLAAVAYGLGFKEEKTFVADFLDKAIDRTIKTSATFKKFMKRTRAISISDFTEIKKYSSKVAQAYDKVTELLNGATDWILAFVNDAKGTLKESWEYHVSLIDRYFTPKLQV